MYKYLLSFLLVLVFKITSLAQVNLVPNGGFEEFTQCPMYSNDLNPDQLVFFGWKSLLQSPDVFHSCATSTDVTTPNNTFGFQYPASGNGYLGLISYYDFIINGRETAQAQLASTMVVGTKYYLRLKFSPSLYQTYEINTLTDNFGILLSTISSNTMLPNYAHLKSNSIVTDTLGWTELFGSIIADSAYKFISLGVLFDDININTQVIYPSQINNYNWSYVYIDDVCISTDSAFCKNFTQQSPNKVKIRELNQLKIYPNPIEDNVLYFSETLYERKLNVVNDKGDVILVIEKYTGSSLQLPINLKEGIYTLLIDGFISKRFILLKK